MLRPLLDALDMALDRTSRIAADPVELPRRYADPDDAEVAALFAASLAYGRADVFKPVVERVLAAMAPSPAAFVGVFARSPEPSVFSGAVYRFDTAPDLAALAAAIGHVRAHHGSLGARFAGLLREAGVARARSAPRSPASPRSPRTRRPSRRCSRAAARADSRTSCRTPPGLAPRSAGTCTCAGWCAAPTASISGFWEGGAARRARRAARHARAPRRARVGLTVRPDASWRTAEEITASLRRLDPADPVRYDFALCHLGMSGACPARRDARRCAACALGDACLTAAGRAPRRRARAARRRSGIARAGTS